MRLGGYRATKWQRERYKYVMVSRFLPLWPLRALNRKFQFLTTFSMEDSQVKVAECEENDEMEVKFILHLLL